MTEKYLKKKKKKKDCRTVCIGDKEPISSTALSPPAEYMAEVHLWLEVVTVLQDRLFGNERY